MKPGRGELSIKRTFTVFIINKYNIFIYKQFNNTNILIIHLLDKNINKGE